MTSILISFFPFFLFFKMALAGDFLSFGYLVRLVAIFPTID